MLALDDLGLAGALEQLVQEEKSRAGWEEAGFLHNIAHRRFDKSLETAVYRVAQEALTNARKHACTQKVRVMLLVKPSSNSGAPLLELEVRDWGSGFVPAEKAGDYSHVGLQGMAERVSLMSGTYELSSRPGEGTRLNAVMPAIDPQVDEDNGGSE
jgi:signal transduction histidine kinase